MTGELQSLSLTRRAFGVYYLTCYTRGDQGLEGDITCPKAVAAENCPGTGFTWFLYLRILTCEVETAPQRS